MALFHSETRRHMINIYLPTQKALLAAQALQTGLKWHCYLRIAWPNSFNLFKHGCILPGLGTYHFSPILLPTRKSGIIRHLENGGNQNFTEAFVTLIVTM